MGAGTLLWSAQVSGVDQVSVVVLNASPLLVDLPAGTMRLMITHVEVLAFKSDDESVAMGLVAYGGL